MKLIYIYSFLFFATLNCFAQTSLNQKEKETITLEIKTMLNDYHDAIVKRGINEELKYLDNSSDFFWVPPNYTEPLDYATVKEILLKNSEAVNFIEFSWEDVKIFPITDTIANYISIVKCVEVDKKNNPISFRIIESGTLIKREKGWKFLSGQSRNIPKN